MHRPEPDTDIDETLGALTDLIRAGKIRSIGSSTFPPSAIVEAQWSAERRGRERFVCEQPPYSMLVRGVEAEVLPTCQRYGMGVLSWSPLAGGWLSGRYRLGGDQPESSRADRIPARYDLSTPENQRKLEVADALAAAGRAVRASLIHLAIAFVIRHPASRRRSSGRGRWSSWRASWAPPTSSWTTTCSMRSTRSCRRAQHQPR